MTSSSIICSSAPLLVKAITVTTRVVYPIVYAAARTAVLSTICDVTIRFNS